MRQGLAISVAVTGEQQLHPLKDTHLYSATFEPHAAVHISFSRSAWYPLQVLSLPSAAAGVQLGWLGPSALPRSAGHVLLPLGDTF